MAAVVASPHVPTRNLDADYIMAGSDVDADGEDEAEVGYAMGDVTLNDAENEADHSDGDAAAGSEEDDDENMEPEDDDDDEAVKIPNGQADAESDDDAVVENMSEVEGSSAEEEADDSDKDSSDAESAAAEEWEGGSADDAEVEVATRNNCV